MKKSRVLICLMMILLLGGVLFACSDNNSEEGVNYPEIASVTVDEAILSSDFTGFSNETFDISQITLYIHYKDTEDESGNVVPGEVTTIQATWDMVKAEDKERLKEVGTKTITLIYGKFEISFPLKIYDSVEQKYSVTFYAEDGTTILGDVQRVSEGGRATQPTVPSKQGYTFIGWLDMDTLRSTTFDNITKDMRLKARYVQNTKTVKYYYKNAANKDTLIAEVEMGSEEEGEDHYPEPPELDGYTFTGWRKDSNDKFYATYTALTYEIKFVYRKYTEGKIVDDEYDYSGKYSDALETVTLQYSAATGILQAPTDYLPTATESKGISDANDYKFIYWYFNRSGKRIKVNLPMEISKMYETTIYAYYVDMSIGSEELRYKTTSEDTCVVSEYVGEGGIVVIPKYTIRNGKVYTVTGIGDGVFKSVGVTEFVVSSDNEYFSVDSGVLYNKTGTVLYAYPSASKMAEYTLKKNTEEVSPYAFYNANNLVDIVMNDNLLHIRDYAFQNCNSLVNIVIPKELLDIGEGAFKTSGDSHITSITFSGTELLSFGDEAFYGLNSLTGLELPASLSFIGDGVFYGCTDLKSIDADKNANYEMYNGALYSSDYRVLYVYPARSEENENPEIMIHPNCRTIARGAFYYANVACITIQSDVELETYSIVCPTLNSLRIDFNGFWLDQSVFLQAFSEFIPPYVCVLEGTDSFDGVTMEGTQIVFYGETTIPEGSASEYNVEKTEGGVVTYKKKTNSTNTSIPNSYARWIGYNNYYNGFVYIANDTGVSIVAYNGQARELTVPTTINNVSVTAIESNAFNGNGFITNVEIPSGVKRIGDQAFRDCKALENVVCNAYVTNLVMGDRVFYGCSQLTDITMIDGIRFASFGEYVFEGTPIMDRTDDFIILGGVLIAYTGSDLSVEIPSSVRYIATDAFKDLGFITEITFAPNSLVSVVDEYAFFNCTGIKQINFPESIREIRSYAFYGCEHLYSVYYSVPQITVSVSEEAYYQAGSFYGGKVEEAFADTERFTFYYFVQGNLVSSTHLGNVIIESYEPEITPSELFIGWYEDATYRKRVSFPITVDHAMTVYARIVSSAYVSGGFKYERNENGEYIITGYEGTDVNVIIGETYMGGDVVGIGENAFNDVLEEVRIPDYLDPRTSQYISRITSIGENAFTNTKWYTNSAGDFLICDNLLLAYKGDAKKVVIPAGITILAEGIFADNHSIEEVIFTDEIGLIPKNAFKGCTSLRRVVLGVGIVRIESGAFSGCTALTDINFEVTLGLYYIAADAFDNTAWLQNVKEDCVIINGILYKYYGSERVFHIPSGVTSISDSAFEGNVKLVSLHIAASVSTIRNKAFKDCISLNAVYIPADGSMLESIMDEAFAGCVNMSYFDFAAATALTEIGDRAFADSASLRSVEFTPSVTRIGEYTFAESGINSVVMKSGIRISTLSDGLFYNCRSLKSVTFEGSNTLSSIGSYVFYECGVLSSFFNPVASIASIGSYAFYNCRSLSDFNVNEKMIKEIGKDAVTGVNYISAQNTNMIILGNILISYTGTDKIVTVPANITLIYDSAFEGNTNIVEVQFASNKELKKINDRAFYGCSSLAKIDFPASVETVGYMVMDGTVWYEDQLESTDYIVINNSLIKYNIDYPRQAEIPSYVTKINRGAFSGSSVYDVKIGQNVELIEEGAFADIIPATWEENGRTLSGWTLTIDAREPFDMQYDSLPEYCVAIYLPDSDTYDKFILDSRWFAQMDLLSVIAKYHIRYSVVEGEANEIRPETVHALYNAKEVFAYKSTAKQFVFVGWFSDAEYQYALSYPYILNKDTTIYAKCIDYDEGSNPSSYSLENDQTKDGYYTILSYGDETDKNVVIITEQANKKIYSITGHLGYIPYYGNAEKKYVFNEEEGVFEEYDEYGNYPEDTVTYRRNSNIEELSFANNCTIEILGDNCFAGMTKLQKVTIPASVKYISAKAFADCAALREVVFSDGIEGLTIEEGAFANCTALQSIIIPVGVTGLEDGAFSGCVNLKEIHLRATQPIVLYAGALPFEMVSGMKIYIPLGRTAAYSSGWIDYYNYLVEEEIIEE